MPLYPSMQGLHIGLGGRWIRMVMKNNGETWLEDYYCLSVLILFWNAAVLCIMIWLLMAVRVHCSCVDWIHAIY